jgi:hypothetical protein
MPINAFVYCASYFLALCNSGINSFLVYFVFHTNTVNMKMQGGGGGGGSDILSLLGPLSATLSGVSIRLIQSNRTSP